MIYRILRSKQTEIGAANLFILFPGKTLLIFRKTYLIKRVCFFPEISKSSHQDGGTHTDNLFDNIFMVEHLNDRSFKNRSKKSNLGVFLFLTCQYGLCKSHNLTKRPASIR